MARTRVLMLSLLAVLALATLVVIGCGDRETTERIERDGERIVSLSPALTQMVKDLGMGERLVGVGRYDPAAGGGVAVVGSLFDIDYERLLSLEPTVVLLQPERAEGVPTLLRELSERHGWRLGSYRIDTIGDALRALYDEGDVAASVGGILDRKDEARALAAEVRGRIERVAERVSQKSAGLARPRVLLVYAMEPLGVFGSGSFLEEVLVAAGGENAMGGGLYQTIDREVLLGVQPEVVVLLRGGGQAVDGRVDEWVAGMKRLAMPAGETGRVYVLADEMALVPSSSIGRVAEKLAVLLHGEVVLGGAD